MAEEFFQRFDALHGHFVEGAVFVEQPDRGDDVQVRVESEVVAERLHSGDGGELAVRKIEPGAEPVLQAGNGFVEEKV